MIMTEVVRDMKEQKKKRGNFDEDFWYYWNLHDNDVDDWY